MDCGIGLLRCFAPFWSILTGNRFSVGSSREPDDYDDDDDDGERGRVTFFFVQPVCCEARFLNGRCLNDVLFVMQNRDERESIFHDDGMCPITRPPPDNSIKCDVCSALKVCQTTPVFVGWLVQKCLR